MRKIKQALITLLWLGLLPCQLFALTISEIYFEGNEVTQDRVLRQELLVHEGEEADAKLIEDSRQAMMNLGLFKSVTSRLEEGDNGSHLIFTLEERYFFLPIPLVGARAKNGNVADGLGSINYGLELRLDNVMGLNQRLKLKYEKEDFEDAGSTASRETSIKYDIPRLIDTPYLLNMQVKQVQLETEEVDLDVVIGSYRREEMSGGFYLSRWLKTESIGHGWMAGGGLNVATLEYSDRVGTATSYSDAQTIALSLGLSYTDIQEHPYHREGETYGYSISVASTQLGSDNGFTHHGLFYRSYRPVQFADSNINTQVRLNVANGVGTTYSVGNSALLRGYDNDYATGNAMLLMNLEYHQHLSGYRQLRGVVFVDVGNAWASMADMDLGNMPTGVGMGLRWRVQSFVDVTLRMDYARSLDSGETKFILNSNASF
ncbi:MAG: BamA/TamA family outer membrane protein [Pseudomonadota bacterium]